MEFDIVIAYEYGYSGKRPSLTKPNNRAVSADNLSSGLLEFINKLRTVAART